MFDLGWGEMLVIAIVIIVVVGPKELPGMLRTFGRTTAKLRVMANDFRKQFDDALKEAELDDLKTLNKDVRKLNPVNEIRKALSPMEEAAKDVRAGLDKAISPTKPVEPPVPKPPVSTPAASTTPAAVAPAKPAAKSPASGAAKAAPAAKKSVAAKPAAAKAPAAKLAAKPAAASSTAKSAPSAKAKAANAPKPAPAAKPVKKAAAKPKSGGAAS